MEQEWTTWGRAIGFGQYLKSAFVTKLIFIDDLITLTIKCWLG